MNNNLRSRIVSSSASISTMRQRRETRRHGDKETRGEDTQADIIEMRQGKQTRRRGDKETRGENTQADRRIEMRQGKQTRRRGDKETRGEDTQGDIIEILEKRTPTTKDMSSRERMSGWKFALASILRSQTALGTIAVFSSTFCLAVAGVSMSLELMMNPDAANWLDPFVPAWSQVPFTNRQAPIPLKVIKAQIEAQGLIPAQPLSLDKLPSPQTNEGLWSHEQGILLPVMAKCSSQGNGEQATCQEIVQLRLYLQVRSADNPDDSDPYYQQISEIDIAGPAESFAIEYLNNPYFDGSNQPLPLTKLERFYRKAPNTGIWFHLSGEATYGEETITYGTIVHYNYQTRFLSDMMQWVSAANQPPTWQEVTGGGEPELIIDRTTGIEPHLSIYQIKPVEFVVNPIELEEISLATPAVFTQGYRDALWLAKAGLWSPAWQMMATRKQGLNKQGKWSAHAQAQMDAIRFHAQVSQAGANASWRNPSQQVLMALLDGRWTQALEVFEAQLALGDTMNDVLTTDQANLWERVEMALRVSQRNNVNLQAWGALLIAAQEGEWQAKDWLKQQPAKQKDRNRILKILDKRSKAIARAQKLDSHRSRIMGNALILSQINPEQWQPAENSPLTLEPGQLWYQVKVIGFHDSLGWHEFPFSDLQLPRYKALDYLWKYLGLHNNSKIQMIVWLPNGKQETTTATVKAVKFQDGHLKLLAAGDPIASADPAKVALTGRSGMSKPLAVTNDTLEWRSPRALTLKQLHKQNPEWVNAMLPVLWYELQRGGEALPGLQPSSEMMLNQMSDWLVQLVDLTGNDDPEAVLTLKPAPTRNISRTRTLILQDNGVLIYSELTSAKGQSVTGIADIKDGGLTALVVETRTGYTLQRWSAERSRFEF